MPFDYTCWPSKRDTDTGDFHHWCEEALEFVIFEADDFDYHSIKCLDCGAKYRVYAEGQMIIRAK